MSLPLRYQISDWHQLTECKSNNSGMLHICVSDIINELSLECTLIQIIHDTYGTLFAYCIDASGRLISDYSLSSDDIIKELARFGFNVTFAKKMNLKSGQLGYLLSLKGLKYDKIRVIHTQNQDHVVAFNSSQLGDWLSNTYNPTFFEFSNAVFDCKASIIPQDKYDWSWLTYVGSIEDILNDNSRTNT